MKFSTAVAKDDHDFDFVNTSDKELLTIKNIVATF